MNDTRAGSRQGEVTELGRSVGALLDAAWGDATSAATGDLDAVRAVAVRHGWLELAEHGAVDFLLAAVARLGRRACPFAIADAYVAARLLPGLAAAIGAGEVRPVVVVGGADDVLLEGAGDATHVLEVGETEVGLRVVRARRAAPGLAVPAWHRLTLGPAERHPLADGAAEEAVAVLRLALAVRCLEAAARAHELAVAHAGTRRQFGRPVGAFGAVQQRVASCHVGVAAARSLVGRAGRLLADGRADGPYVAALAARLVRDGAAGVVAGAQHTLGAVGYFEEHEVPWLFRRVHADLTLLRSPGVDDASTDLGGGVVARLVDAGRPLPAFDLGPAAEALRREVRDLLARHARPVCAAHPTGHDADGVRGEAAAAGLFAPGWPDGLGGRAATAVEQAVVHEEMKYAGGPVDRAMSATMLIGHALLRHGTPAQQGAFLPLVREGRMAFCLGYSEPEAGSDLASLRTRAVRDGDDWVVDGQKVWTTRAHTATHVWLAVRTDPDAVPRHAGITVLLVAMDSPGITVHRHVALSGEISCTVFLDAVRVPDAARVGEVHGGWAVVADALAAERVVMGGVVATLRRHLDELVALLRRPGSPPPDDVGRDRLARLAARLQAARALVLDATQAVSDGDARIAGPVAAILGGDLAEELGRVALDLLGPGALLSAGAEGALDAGRFEAAHRLAPMYVIGGGTNDIQRGLVARGLGLPRE